MNRPIKVLLFLCLLINQAAMADSMKIEIIPMQHRPVDDVVPIIKPLVAEGGTVTGANNQLIVKTTPANLKQIKEVLEQIDYAPRKLMISVRQDIDGNFRNREDGLSGRYDSDNIDITVPDRSKRGTIIEDKDGDGNVIRYRSMDTRSRIEDDNAFRVQTVEGQPAWINTGESVPVANATTYVTPGGMVVQEGVEYRDVTSGFYVLPRIQGNNVTLAVSPKLQRVQPHQRDSFDIQGMETVARGRLGEWLEIGSVAQQFNDDAQKNTISTKRRGQELRTILIKVDQVK